MSSKESNTNTTHPHLLPPMQLPAALHGFTLIKTAEFPDLHLRAALLRHEKSGAVLYHFDRDDPVRAFLVAFRTPPTDSSGVQHILEHTALCGSKRYPVRDPFFKMLTRSFATFMNAMTATDYTMYPFSTLNANDYVNLLRVYLDAVFRPNLLPQDFAQEGWRIEHADPRDPTTPLELKGVVYSEMKGVMSDTGSLFQYAVMKAVNKGCIYEHVSGGEPACIPSLTHADLVAFHRSHYAPHAAHFFTYGRAEQVLADALPEIAAVIDSHPPIDPALKLNFDSLPIWPTKSSSSPDHSGGSDPQDMDTVRLSCAPDTAGDPERQTRMCLSYVTNDASDTYKAFAMSILSELLTSGASSPLHRALIASGLATQYAPGTGYDHSTRACTLTLGAQGLRADDVAKAEAIIVDVLATHARDGFSADKIDAALHRVELRLRKMSPKFGMNLLMSAANSATLGVDAFAALDAVAHLRRLRDQGPDSVFRGLLADVLARSHRAVRVIMTPDPEYAADVARKERELLESRTARLTPSDRASIVALGKDLLARQDAKQDLSVLPCLKLTDIEPRAKAFPLTRDAALYSRSSATNGIAYLGTISLLPAASVQSKDMLAALPLFANAMTWQGTKQKSMEDLDVEIRANTGGISFDPTVISDIQDDKKYQIALTMTGLALEEKVSDLTRLVLELVKNTNFENEERLRVLIGMSLSNMMDSIAYSGHQFAIGVAASLVNPSSQINEMWNGLSQIRYLTEISKNDEKIKELVKTLMKIRETFLSSAITRTHLVATEAKCGSIKKHLADAFIPEYPHNGTAAAKDTVIVAPKPIPAQETQQSSAAAAPLKQVYVPAPYQVGYAACVVRTDAGYLHPDSAALHVASQLLSQLFMHREVREKGGAYGGGATFSTVSGNFTMYSYRDPRVADTRRAMDAGVAWLAGDKVPASTPTPPPQPTAQELLEAKLKIFASVDAPLAPNCEGWSEFEQGLTLEMRQARRERLFAVTAEDVQRVAKKYLLPASRIDVAYAIIGPQSLEESFAKDGWKIQRSEK